MQSYCNASPIRLEMGCNLEMYTVHFYPENLELEIQAFHQKGLAGNCRPTLPCDFQALGGGLGDK